jgi:hypothetical protein
MGKNPQKIASTIDVNDIFEALGYNNFQIQ